HPLSRRPPSAARTRHRRTAYRMPDSGTAPTRSVGTVPLFGAQSAGFKELRQQRATLVRADAADHLGSVIESTITDDVPQRADGTGLGIPGPEDKSSNPAEHDGAGTHGARLQSHDQGAAVQVPGPPAARGPAQRDELGVRSRIAIYEPFIGPGRQNGAVRPEHGRA